MRFGLLSGWLFFFLAASTTHLAGQGEKDASIKRLIGELGSDDPAVRDTAAEKLFWEGGRVVGHLREAAKGDDPEVKRRAEHLLSRLDAPPVGGLRLRLIPSKDRFELGEPISVVVELKNVSQKTLTIFKWPNPMATWTRDIPASKVEWKRTWSKDDADPFIVRTRSGTLLKNTSSTPEKGPGKDLFIPLAPGESHREKCILNWAFEVTSAGKYRVDAAYSDTFFSASQARDEWKLDPWTGFLRANTVILEVVPPTRGSLAATAEKAARGDRGAIRKLALIKRPEVIPALKKALTLSDEGVRRDATIALVKIGGEEVYPILLGRARMEPDQKLRILTIHSVGYLEEERALREVTGLLEEPVPPEVKVAVIRLARELGDRAFDAILIETAFRAELDDSVRKAAISLLGDWKVAGAAERLREVAGRESTSNGEKYITLYALADMKDPWTLDYAIRDLTSGEGRTGAGLLYRYPGKKATEALLKVARDPDHRWRRSAGSALAERGNPVGYPFFIDWFRRIVEAHEKGTRRSAWSSRNIYMMVARFEGLFLRPILSRENGMSGGELGQALPLFEEWWKKNQATFDLRKTRLAGLSHPVRRIRQYAAEAFRRKPDTGAVPKLRAMVGDPKEDPTVRRTAATTLLLQGDLTGLDFLLDHAGDHFDHHMEWDQAAKLVTSATGRGFFNELLCTTRSTEERIFTYNALKNQGYEWFRKHRDRLTWDPRLGIYNVRR